MKKTSLKMNRQSIAKTMLTAVSVLMLITSCKKDNDHHQDDASKYSSEVIEKWMNLQVRLMKNTPGPNHGFSRHFAYAGVAALESLAPGLSAHTKKFRKWNGLTGLPVAPHGAKYYYPSNVNAALASINRLMFPTANATDKAAIDSLEFALNLTFYGKETQSVLSASANYGIAVANAVFNWGDADGFKNANAPYTAPTGPGMWVPAVPGQLPATPFWGNNRPIIIGSITGTQAPAPIAYSTHPGSPFYLMVKQVYDASQVLTEDQKAMATFWRDVPGVTTPGHWVSIVSQVVKQANTKLDKAALAYALGGTAMSDAFIAVFKAKYQYNLVRPITYIRDVMGYSGWNTWIGTPAHPEYVSAHSSASAAVAWVLKQLFGNIGTFTDHTYDYLGFAPRSYNSIYAVAEEAGQSRLYAGIHYQQSIDAGLTQGKKVASNILSANGN